MWTTRLLLLPATLILLHFWLLVSDWQAKQMVHSYILKLVMFLSPYSEHFAVSLSCRGNMLLCLLPFLFPLSQPRTSKSSYECVHMKGIANVGRSTDRRATDLTKKDNTMILEKYLENKHI